MDSLTPEQAQALWEAGGFFILADLPQGSEFGIDGTIHVTRRFSGIKFVPPGLHLATWTPPSEGALAIKSGYIKAWSPKDRVALRYDAHSESVSSTEIISDDHLGTLDPTLAAYPFAGLDSWKLLTSHITEDVLDQVVKGGHVDGMKEDLGFVEFDLKRSWPPGAVGEDLTRWSRDKSWLLGSVMERLQDPFKLLAQLQLAFILILHLSSFTSIEPYKRILSLFCQSSHLFVAPSEYIKSSNPQKTLAAMTISLLETLAAQLQALPEGVFATELPEMDVFYLEQLDSLRNNLSGVSDTRIESAWARVESVGRKHRWDLEQDDSDEEGEFAPTIVHD